jgi:hypothetical protein
LKFANRSRSLIPLPPAATSLPLLPPRLPPFPLSAASCSTHSWIWCEEGRNDGNSSRSSSRPSSSSRAHQQRASRRRRRAARPRRSLHGLSWSSGVVLPSSPHAGAEKQVELLLAAGGAAAGCCSRGGGAADLLSTSTDGTRRLGPARQRERIKR